MINHLRESGVLRTLLFALTVVLIGLAPFSGGQLEWTPWGVITTLIAPAMFVIVVFVLPLEITMTRIFMSGMDTENRSRLSRVQRTTIILFVVLVLAWAPYVYRLLSLK